MNKSKWVILTLMITGWARVAIIGVPAAMIYFGWNEQPQAEVINVIK